MYTGKVINWMEKEKVIMCLVFKEVQKTTPKVFKTQTFVRKLNKIV